MFIKNVFIENFRCFRKPYIPEFKVPDNENEGSGLNVLAGENGTGKTAVLDAISLLTQSRLKTQGELSIEDFNSIDETIKIYSKSDNDFNVKRAIPGSHIFKSSGFEFTANIRKNTSTKILTPLTFDNKYIQSSSDTTTLLAPELRQDVQNPYGPRFSDLQIVYFDQNRTRHSKSGKFAPSKFDDLVQDLNFQFLYMFKNLDKRARRKFLSMNDKLRKTYTNLVEDKILSDPILYFKGMTGHDVSLDLLNLHMPYTNSFFTVLVPHKGIQIPIEKLGSGLEMIFSILFIYFFYKSRNINTILLIDEPELHLHPKLQEDFVKLLLNISKNSQVFIATHSPFLLQPIIRNKNATLYVFKKSKTGIRIKNLKTYKKKLFPWSPSWGEVNYLAYGFYTVEFHNELYGYLQFKKKKYTVPDVENFLISKGITLSKKWIPMFRGKALASKDSTLCTYIRNTIHHSENTLNQQFTPEELKNSTEILIKLLR